MGRAPCCEKVGLKKGRWTAEEDKLLLDYIKAHGEGSWRSLPKNAGLLRCGKSCRLRWINYLRADVKRGNISVEEEETILKLRAAMGNRWSVIASHLPGRTDNEIKNYWNSHLSKKARQASAAESPEAHAGPARRPRRGQGSAPAARKKRSPPSKKASATAAAAEKPRPSDRAATANAASDGACADASMDCCGGGGEHETCEAPGLRRELEEKPEEVIQELLAELQVSAPPDPDGGSTTATATESDEGSTGSSFQGLESIPWEEEDGIWQWLCDAGDLDLSMDLDFEAQAEKPLADLLDGGLETWLMSDTI